VVILKLLGALINDVVPKGLLYCRVYDVSGFGISCEEFGEYDESWEDSSVMEDSLEPQHNSKP